MSVTLISSDECKVTVSISVAKMSVTIKNMIEDLGEDEGGTTEISLSEVTGDILKKVVEWCEYHHGHPEPTSEESTGGESDEKPKTCMNEIPEWDKNFIPQVQKPLFDLILAANYLDIKELLEITCKTVANMIIGKTPDDIRKMFSITNDFTPEEEEAVRKENEW